MSNRVHVVLAAVISLDGKIKRGTKTHTREWISNEDKALFAQLVSDSDVVIAGRKTYCNMRSVLQANTHYVIYTRSPGTYNAAHATNRLEFTDENPVELVGRLRANGYRTILIAGGKDINTLFLNANLVDELVISVEPILHGSGTPMLQDRILSQALRLLELRQLNLHGTLLLRYRVVRSW